MNTKKQFIKIEDLLVNPKNFRFDPVANQKEAINIMINKMKQKVKKQAEDIAKYGLNPIETLAVTKTYNGKYIVHEGNRRLTAIKLIDNPRIIPLDKKTKLFFQKLKENYGENLPSQIECTVFSQEQETHHWIQLKHTGENDGAGVVRWNNKQQGRFEAYITDTKPKKHIQVQNFMETNEIPFQGYSTTLQRLINNPDVRKKIGIYFENGDLKYKSKQTAIDNLNRISSAMKKPDFTVRKLEHVKDIKKWINGILSDELQSTAVTRRKERIVKRTTKRSTLIPQDFAISISHQRIDSICKELKKLDIDKYTNAVAVLFRVFLELSINHFIEKKEEERVNLLKELEEKPKKNNQGERNIFLRQKMTIVCKYMEKEKKLTKNELHPVRIAIEKRYDISSIQTFNSYVHNLDHFPSDNDLKNSWNNMQKFISKLWEQKI